MAWIELQYGDIDTPLRIGKLDGVVVCFVGEIKMQSLLMAALVLVAASVSAMAQLAEPTHSIDERGRSVLSNWRGEATRNLEAQELGGAARRLNAGDLANRTLGRCIYINNYWCTKQILDRAGNVIDIWDDSLPPNVDKDKHALFKNADAGGRAAVRNVRTKFFRPAASERRQTLRGLYCDQAPRGKCRGDDKNPDGTCKHGTNECDKLALKMANQMGVSPDQRLPFFYGTNENTAVASQHLRTYLRLLSRDEVSPERGPRILAKRQLIERAIKREQDDRRADPTPRAPRPGA